MSVQDQDPDQGNQPWLSPDAGQQMTAIPPDMGGPPAPALPSTPESAEALSQPSSATPPPAAPAAPPAPESPLAPTPEDAMSLGGPSKSIARYLQGADAAPRQVVQALETKVDPQNTMDQNERSMRTIEAAAADSPDVAWGVMQYYRANYNALRAATAVSLAKGANPEVVSKNFNAAYSYLPDGNKMTMAPSKSGGYVIQVHTIGGASQSFDVSPEQLNQFVHPGNKEGAFDNLIRPDTPDQVAQVMQQVQGSAGQAIDKLQQGGATQQEPSTPATPGGTGQPATPAPAAPQGAASAPAAAPAPAVKPAATPQRSEPEDPFAGFDPQKVTQARYMFNGNLPQMLNYLAENAQKSQELQSHEQTARGRGAEAAQTRAEALANAPVKPGTDTAEARNLRNQSRNDTQKSVNYDKTFSTLQRDLLKQVNPATNKNYTPDEAVQQALQTMKAGGMSRPGDQNAPEPQGAPQARPQAANAGGGNAPRPQAPQVGTQVATPQGAPPAQAAQPAPAAPTPGRTATKANQPEIRKDPTTGQLFTKDARGNVVPYQQGQ